MGVNVAEIFGQNVFDETVMKDRLPESTYAEIKKIMHEGGDITPDIANVVAQAMKEWAIEKGATHYTHVFQPYITSIGAEKHDSFASIPRDGKIDNTFTGKDLLMDEPDGSSFPSGGLRRTSEARAYTAWDVTSPVYLRDDTLCIPTAFCSYTGESLDTKTPLLKAMHAASKYGVRLLRLLGNTTSRRVLSYVGPEQEYFLIPKDLYDKRQDLRFAGRTLFGAKAPKGQEMSDHYFGMIRENVQAYMADVDEKLWKMGIPVKTQHNEGAPCQHEVAPIFSVANVALDNNYVIMTTLKNTAEKYGLACLLHEKPFEGVNGSGKHNNWSLTTDDGINLFDSGKNPENNKLFQLVLACLMSAVDKHAALLRAAASNTGNDHRLGAHEAPPAIISMYLGDQIADVVDQILKTGKAESSNSAGTISFGINKLPILEKDPTDRNRTSPFAFTGNRFEFRMVAASNSIGDTNVVLNTMMAEAFDDAYNALEGAEDMDKAIEEYIAKLMREHQRILFNGNGYTKEWEEEAERRGLPNCKSIVDAIPSLLYKDTIEMYERFGVLSEAELKAREEILFEQYSGVRNIEARTMIDMAERQIVPAVINYTKELADTINAISKIGVDVSTQVAILNDVTVKLNETKTALDKLKKVLEEANNENDNQARAIAFKSKVMDAMNELRRPADELETMVDKEIWPFPTYGDILFY